VYTGADCAVLAAGAIVSGLLAVGAVYTAMICKPLTKIEADFSRVRCDGY
jgi:hypothetical protein